MVRGMVRAWLVLLVAFVGSSPARADLIAYWNFNDSNLTVDSGSGTLTTDFPGGSVGYGTGTTTNAALSSAAGNALRLTSKNNNGSTLTFAVATAGYQSLAFSYATSADSGSFTTQTIAYSTDGTNFTDVSPTYTVGASYATASYDFAAIAGLTNNANAKIRVTFTGAGSANNKYNFLDNVQFNATAMATVAVSTPVSATIITGGSANLGATVANTAASGSANLSYTLGANVQTGSISLGSVAPTPSSLAPGNSQAHTVAASSTHVGLNTVRFTPNGQSANTPAPVDADLTVLAHSNAAFEHVAGDHALAQISVDGNTLTIDFGSVAVGSGPRSSTFDLANLIAVAGYTAALDLDAVVGSGDVSVLSLLGSTTFTNLAAGSDAGYTVAFDTASVGSFSATHLLKLSDQDLSGASSPQSEVLTLNLVGQVVAVPEPAALAMFAAGLLLVNGRKRAAH